MKAWIVLIALAGTAHAGSEAWVGGWTGKVTSKGCTDDGKKTVTLDVAMTSEGGLRASGDVLEDGLGDLDWTEAGKSLSGNRTGMTASLSAKGKLAIATDGGCKITGTLKRATSGIAACDRLLALATMESQCKSDTTRLDDAHAHWKAWKKLEGKKKTAQAAQCQSDADMIATEVASCTGGASGIDTCDELVRVIASLQQCPSLPQGSKDGMTQMIEQLKQQWSQADEASRPAMRDACKQSSDAMKQSMAAMGCPF